MPRSVTIMSLWMSYAQEFAYPETPMASELDPRTLRAVAHKFYDHLSPLEQTYRWSADGSGMQRAIDLLLIIHGDCLRKMFDDEARAIEAKKASGE